VNSLTEATRWIARRCAPANEYAFVCHCEGASPTAAIQLELHVDRHVAALLAMTGNMVIRLF